MPRDFLPSSDLGDEESALHIAVPARMYSTRDPHPIPYGEARSRTPDENRSSVGAATSSLVTQPPAGNLFPGIPARTYSTRDSHPIRYDGARTQTPDESRSSVGAATSSLVTQPSTGNQFPEMPADGYAITSRGTSSVNSHITRGYPSDILHEYI